MNNSPLTNTEKYKVSFFICILSPTILVGLGVIPTLIILLALIQTRKKQDFSYFESGSKGVKSYFLLLFILGLATSLFQYLNDHRPKMIKHENNMASLEQLKIEWPKQKNELNGRLLELEQKLNILGQKNEIDISPDEKFEIHKIELEKLDVQNKIDSLYQDNNGHIMEWRLYAGMAKYSRNKILLMLLYSLIPLLYLYMFNIFFYKVIVIHKDWVLENGIFSSKKC